MDADWRPQWRVDLIPTYKTHRLAAEQPEAAAGTEGTANAEEIPDTLSPRSRSSSRCWTPSASPASASPATRRTT